MYGIKKVEYIHGTLDDKIKIGYSKEISMFNKELGSLEYPKFEEIIVKSKRDLPDRQSRYDNGIDDQGYPISEVYPVRERLEFHNDVKDDIIMKNTKIEQQLQTGNKSLFKYRVYTMKMLKSLNFSEIVIIGH